MRSKRAQRTLTTVAAGLVVLGLAGLLGFVGCGGADKNMTTPAGEGAPWVTATTAAPMNTATRGQADYDGGGGTAARQYSSTETPERAWSGAVTASVVSGQKIISDAQLEIEVERGRFETVLDQAILLADRYGGYLVSSTSYAGGEDDAMRSGTVAIRVPSASFTQALSDAAKLGTLKNQSLYTQDVTEEYVDLQARMKNSEAYVDSISALLRKAETIDDTLTVQSVLNRAQEELEALKGRLRYLDEHTGYSTIAMTIYEIGAVLASGVDWGVIAALKDGLYNLVKAFNAVIRGLGVLIPVLVVLAVVAFIVYRICLILVRRNRERRQARYQAHPQGWGSQAASVGQPVPVDPGQAGVAQTGGPQVPAAPYASTTSRSAASAGLENAGAQQASGDQT